MVRAFNTKPSCLAIAAAVYESSPPLSNTTACGGIDPFGDSAIRRSDITKSPNHELTQSHAACGGMPDELVKLELHLHGQTVGEHPLRQKLRIQCPVDRREKNGIGAAFQLPQADVAGELVVRAIRDRKSPSLK